MKTTNNYNMSLEEAQEYVSKQGLDILWNDGDVFIDGREITRTVGDVLKWADDSMIDKVCKRLKSMNIITDAPVEQPQNPNYNG